MTTTTDPTPKAPRLLIAGHLELLHRISTFCRRVYYDAFGPEEGERRFAKLTLIEAVALWREGLPYSNMKLQ